mgnify:CR=1 FL=1
MCNFQRINSLKKVVDKVNDTGYNNLCNASGDDGVEETLLSIPNRTVKLYSVDGTAWETVWESRTLPGNR